MFCSFVSFGAILIILSVPMDSFVQLAIGKTNAMIYKNDSFAQISYAKRYSGGTFTAATLAYFCEFVAPFCDMS